MLPIYIFHIFGFRNQELPFLIFKITQIKKLIFTCLSNNGELEKMNHSLVWQKLRFDKIESNTPRIYQRSCQIYSRSNQKSDWASSRRGRTFSKCLGWPKVEFSAVGDYGQKALSKWYLWALGRESGQGTSRTFEIYKSSPMPKH